MTATTNLHFFTYHLGSQNALSKLLLFYSNIIFGVEYNVDADVFPPRLDKFNAIINQTDDSCPSFCNIAREKIAYSLRSQPWLSSVWTSAQSESSLAFRLRIRKVWCEEGRLWLACAQADLSSLLWSHMPLSTILRDMTQL